MRIEQELFIVSKNFLRLVHENGIMIGEKPEKERFSYSSLEDILKRHLEYRDINKLELTLRMDNV